jgi:hypothetical protein
MSRRQFRHARISVAAALVVSLLAAPALLRSAAGAEGETPGTRPARATRLAAPTSLAAPGGLHVVVNERGKISPSISAVATEDAGTVTVRKPPGAVVRRAYLATATTGFSHQELAQPIVLNGGPVPLTGGIPNGIESYNYFADVTSLVKTTLDAAPSGSVAISYAEPDPQNTDGSILEVIYDDPAIAADQSVTILYGALQPTGDTYTVNLAEPIRLDDPKTRLEMSLGISYSFQQGGVQQYSTVDVNGARLTSAAGGEDDGLPSNGGLITAGGEGDSIANPADPNALPTQPRSDDELYDLQPFVHSGDEQVRIATNNPSLDDNVFLATLIMNPPVSTVATGGADFVYVALGDSYQSGEGAAVALRPASKYLSEGFENGSNFPAAVGAQENTYSDGAQGPTTQGNSCHRALLNYAKINRDRLEPTKNVLLIDRTCSGAQIEPGGKPPIVGSLNKGVDPTSQVQQALDRLKDQGLTAADVDLVTVGMGGNDARFGDIVAACVGPALLEAALRKYPNAPAEVNWIAQQATCSRVDGWFVKTGDALKTLRAKEEYAQRAIKAAFPQARVMQVDYPNILPLKDSPSWCGGLRGKDVDYAKQRIVDINARIRAAAKVTGTELIDVEPTFGPNALCPGSNGRRLANGIDQGSFDKEVDRLLNLDGRGDSTSGRLLEDLVRSYRALKSCMANKANPFDGSDCNLTAAKNDVIAKAEALLAYFGQQNGKIFGNIMSPPGTTDDSQAVAFDRSRNLFHPNADGYQVQACGALNVYQGNAPGATCSSAGSTTPSRGWLPTVVSAGDLLRLVVEYFRANSVVRLRVYSDEVELGTAVADAQGTVRADVRIPSLSPGVHRLELQGEGADGVQVTQEVLVKVPGRPSGSYATYLTGFLERPTPSVADAPIETVTATLHGSGRVPGRRAWRRSGFGPIRRPADHKPRDDARCGQQPDRQTCQGIRAPDPNDAIAVGARN